MLHSRLSYRVAVLAIAVLVLAPFVLHAQRVLVRPLSPVARDTNDHVDLAYRPNVAGHATANVVAIVYSAAGRMQTGQRVTWSTSDSSVATVSGIGANGVVLARGYGFATLRATVTTATGVLTDALQVCVSGPANPLGVQVTPLDPYLRTGASLQFVAADRFGAPIPPACIHWSLDAALGTVTRRGLVTATSPIGGKMTVTAYVGVLPFLGAGT